MTREFSRPRFSLENVLNGKDDCKEVISNYAGSGKRRFLSKCFKLWPQLKVVALGEEDSCRVNHRF
jgi:hypothetical protein